MPKAKWTLTDAAAKRILDRYLELIKEDDRSWLAPYDKLAQAVDEEGLRTYDAEEKVLRWAYRNEQYSVVSMVAEDVVRRFKDLRKSTRDFLCAFDSLSNRVGHKHYHQHDEEE